MSALTCPTVVPPAEVHDRAVGLCGIERRLVYPFTEPGLALRASRRLWPITGARPCRIRCYVRRTPDDYPDVRSFSLTPDGDILFIFPMRVSGNLVIVTQIPLSTEESQS